MKDINGDAKNKKQLSTFWRKKRKKKAKKEKATLWSWFSSAYVVGAVAPVATSLLNGIVGNGVNFFKMYSERRIYFRTNGKWNCWQRYSTNNYFKKLD